LPCEALAFFSQVSSSSVNSNLSSASYSSNASCFSPTTHHSISPTLYSRTGEEISANNIEFSTMLSRSRRNSPPLTLSATRAKVTLDNRNDDSFRRAHDTGRRQKRRKGKGSSNNGEQEKKKHKKYYADTSGEDNNQALSGPSSSTSEYFCSASSNSGPFRAQSRPWPLPNQVRPPSPPQGCLAGVTCMITCFDT
jgi:hypothetical protein